MSQSNAINLSNMAEDVVAKSVSLYWRYSRLSVVVACVLHQVLKAELRKTAKKLSSDRQYEELCYFGIALDHLVAACGGLAAVRAIGRDRGNNLIETLAMRLFDELPHGCCVAAFRSENDAINQDLIWTVDSPKTQLYRTMFREKFRSLLTCGPSETTSHSCCKPRRNA